MARSKKDQTPSPGRLQLHRIIGRLSDGVIFVEEGGTISWANDAALAMHGVTSLAALGGTAEGYRKRFHLALCGGRALSAETYPIARLGRGDAFDDLVVDVCRVGHPEPDWVHRCRGLVLRHEGDEPDCLVLVIIDATEAFEAEERFESMFNANPAPALIVRLDDYRYVRVSEGFLERSGWSRDDLIGHSIYDLDILDGAEAKEQAKTFLKKGRTIPLMEAELPVPGGSKLVLLAGHPSEMNNEPCMIFTFADLKSRRKAEMALRQSEERFATAFRFVPVPMLLTSLDRHRILDVNHAFLEITGWGYEAVVGRRPADIELWETATTRHEIERRIAESGSFRGYELQLKTRTGELVTCLVSAETVTINGQYCRQPKALHSYVALTIKPEQSVGADQ